MGKLLTAVVAGLLVTSTQATFLEVDVNDDPSIKSAAKYIAAGVRTYYNGTAPGETVGVVGSPYYWWESGLMWGALIDYWFYTGDPGYNDVVQNGLLAQVGEDKDFLPANQASTEGNDDQALWALAALSAAEKGFPKPSIGEPQWLDLAQATFDSQAARWDTTTCNGGLRWQIFTFNNGYNYKNSMTQGTFFQLAARLAQFTGNQTYADWAIKSWDWASQVGLVTDDYKVYDGTNTVSNCSQVNKIQWSQNAGAFLYGSAVMYNMTGGNKLWRTRTQGLLDATSIFFSKATPDVMVEVACESRGKCTLDQQAFKAGLGRWMGATTKAAPFTREAIQKRLRASTQAAAKQCKHTTSTTVQCGFDWAQPGSGEPNTLSSQLSALEVVQANLAAGSKSLATVNRTSTAQGGSSSSTSAGSSGSSGTGTSASPSATKSSAAAPERKVSGGVQAAGLWLAGLISLVIF